MKSTIFISGPHGSGKSTLLNKLLSSHELFFIFFIFCDIADLAMV